ncbi:NRDE family protein [Flectobacillus major]|jgi:hypothetical protein|uniref:NRDE family protein n=1 Tax=Flectobacillus major TaxID=103 RepID=UPI0003F7A1E2|nr:NRDE family protein [Flectobacillus major]
MCVLTFLPTSVSGFILTNNRDEAVARPKAIPPKQYTINGQCLFMPKDTQAGGTWIATSQNYTLCLLNGAFEKHTPQPPYRQSRGQIILDFFQYNTISDFYQNYNFIGIENFTLIIINHQNQTQICEIRWDGQALYNTSKNPTIPHIWSSATLYSAEVMRQREHWFKDFLQQNPDFSGEDVVDFHRYGGTGDIQNDMTVNRNNELVTQCIMQINRVQKNLTFSFHDLLEQQDFRYRVF